nr:helicase-related protein [Micromonospora sp. DSM 115978]
SLACVPMLARHTAAVLGAQRGAGRKVCVLDLDNTVWGGVIGEDGLAGIVLGDGPAGEAFVAFQRYVLELKRKGVVLAAMTKLKQVCNHPAHLLGDGSPLAGRSGKLARLEELLDVVLADGERALCFTQFARFGAALAPYLADRFGVEVPFLHGGTARAERDRLVERFQTGRGPGIFLLSLKAGGFGLNLTAANHVMHLDRWWNPATESQATDRAYRIGQRRGVQVHTFVCMGTLEERVDRMLADKASLARTTISTGESWLAALTTDQLRELVRLAPTTAEAAGTSEAAGTAGAGAGAESDG